MNNGKKRCSTPLRGHEAVWIDPALSEVRRRQINGPSASEIESVPAPKKRSKCQPRIIIEKNFDWEFDDEDLRSIDSSSNNTNSCGILGSPSGENYDNYEARYLKSLEDDTAPISPDPVISSPVFQKRFRDKTQFRSYSGPGIWKPRLSPSQISFSPKWVNRVAPKFNSPSDIPSREWTLTSPNENPASPSWYSEASLPPGKQIWEDFVKETSSLSKSATFNRKNRAVRQPATGSKFSHLRVPNDQYKKFESPTRQSAVYDKENVAEGLVVARKNMPREQLGKCESQSVGGTSNRARDNNVSKAKTLVYKNASPDIQNWKLEAVKKARSSPECSEIDSVSRLGVQGSSKQNNESTLNTDRSLSGTGSPPQKKSKLRILSTEVIKKPYLL